MLRQGSPQPLEVAQLQRYRPAPRRTVGRVGEAHESLALVCLEQLHERGEALVPRALLQRQLFDRMCGAPGSRHGLRS